MEITRDGVIRAIVAAIVAAIEAAEAQGDPGAMIKGAAELNRMLGFYRPAGGGDEAVSDDTASEGWLKRMSSEELMALIESE